MPVRPEDAPRRYADICHKNFVRWGVWDPARGPKVGSYGHINFDTGALDVDGNVYDPEFQKYIDECDGIQIADYPPVYSEEPPKSVLNSIWTRKKEFEAPSDAPDGVDSASTKGQWWFQKERSCAILLMHQPREQVLPGPVLEELFKIPILKHKHLVTRVIHCSAYARYLSSTGGEHITLSLRGSDKATSDTSDEARPALEWFSKGCEAGYLHTGVNQNGDLCYTPAFFLRQKYPLIRSLLRDVATPDPKPDTYWCTTFPPWKPLDDDGIEGDFEPDTTATKEAQMRATGDIARNHVYGV